MALPPDNAAAGATLRPRIWLVNTTGGIPQLPQSVDINDGGTPRTVHIWNRFEPCSVGGFPAREYRHEASGRLCVLVRIATLTLGDGRTGALVLAWAPVPNRSGNTPLWDAIEAAITANVVRSWACNLDSDGSTWLTTAMDASGGAMGTLARNNWPAGWRKYVAGDPIAGPYTGARIIGAVIAT